MYIDMDTIDIAIEDAKVHGLICYKCGGYGGEQLNQSEHGDEGWMPCFYCSNTGFVSWESWLQERAETKVNVC